MPGKFFDDPTIFNAPAFDAPSFETPIGFGNGYGGIGGAGYPGIGIGYDGIEIPNRPGFNANAFLPTEPPAQLNIIRHKMI